MGGRTHLIWKYEEEMLTSCAMGYSLRLGPPSEGGRCARSLGGPFSSTSRTSSSSCLLSLSGTGGRSTMVSLSPVSTAAFNVTLHL